MTENLYTPNCIRTISGRYVNILEPTPDMIDIHDIAHGLARQYRFGGHTVYPFTVLEHSMQVAMQLPQKHKIAGLLHDASEAYLGDMPSPIKKHMPDYKAIEARLMMVIAQKFGFEYPLAEAVKEADKAELELEWAYIVLKGGSVTQRESDLKNQFIELYHMYKMHFTNNQ